MTTREVPILPVSAQIEAARSKWEFDGRRRPEFAEPTAAGDESVWDFPRPPLIVPVAARLRVVCDGIPVAETESGVRVLETAGAPTYYFPPRDVDPALVEFGDMVSICEWKGVAQAVHVAGRQDAGWRYVRMFEAFAQLHEWLSFYPSRLECYVGDARAEPQPGGYYGGWVLGNLRGPIKGGPGTQDW